MIDIPPHIEQVIIAKAEQQGVSVAMLLERTFGDNLALLAEQDGLNSDTPPTLSPAELQTIWDDLDTLPRPNPQLQALIKQYGGLNASY